MIRSLRSGQKLPSNFIHRGKDLYVLYGVLFCGEQIVVPHALRPDMLTRIHEGHQGIVKCKRRARQSLYWPGITNDVAEMCKSCNLCMKYQYQQPPEPLTQEHQESPWHKVAFDIYTSAGKDYLLVVDYFSNYPEVMLLGSKTARSVIDAMKSIFLDTAYQLSTLVIICHSLALSSSNLPHIMGLISLPQAPTTPTLMVRLKKGSR